MKKNIMFLIIAGTCIANLNTGVYAAKKEIYRYKNGDGKWVEVTTTKPDGDDETNFFPDNFANKIAKTTSRSGKVKHGHDSKTNNIPTTKIINEKIDPFKPYQYNTDEDGEYNDVDKQKDDDMELEEEEEEEEEEIKEKVSPKETSPRKIVSKEKTTQKKKKLKKRKTRRRKKQYTVCYCNHFCYHVPHKKKEKSYREKFNSRIEYACQNDYFKLSKDNRSLATQLGLNRKRTRENNKYRSPNYHTGYDNIRELKEHKTDLSDIKSVAC